MASGTTSPHSVRPATTSSASDERSYSGSHARIGMNRFKPLGPSDGVAMRCRHKTLLARGTLRRTRIASSRIFPRVPCRCMLPIGDQLQQRLAATSGRRHDRRGGIDRGQCGCDRNTGRHEASRQKREQRTHPRFRAGVVREARTRRGHRPTGRREGRRHPCARAQVLRIQGRPDQRPWSTGSMSSARRQRRPRRR